MNELINVNESTMTVSARELHEKLGIDTPFTMWFDRMRDYGFTEGEDFFTKMLESTGGRPATDYDIALDMAKQICMIQRTPEGKMIRQYFIDLEKAWNTPEQIMARALRIAEETLEKTRRNVRRLEAENAALEVENQRLLPKAEYFDELVDRNTLTNITDTASALGIKRKVFIKFLLDQGFVYRNKRGALMPRANQKAEGLFEVKQCCNSKTNWTGVQALITPKGVETFRLLCAGL